jgi:ATP-dependent helicase HepA
MAAHYLARRLTDQWVERRDHDDGLGLCRSVGGSTADIDYFDVPGRAPIRLTVPVNELRLPFSYVGRHAWLADEQWGYHSATITSWSARCFGLELATGVQTTRIPKDVIIRRGGPVLDVLEPVRTGAVHSASLHLARRDLLRELLLQRHASQGYDAVLSSAIELYDHQLETVQRVLEDPVLRFILADEVGLGKTIEAGMIIRQTVLDSATTTVYVSAPSKLVGQWERELEEKFLLTSELGLERNRQARVFVRGHGLLLDDDKASKASLVVIDEAHQLVDGVLSGGRWSRLDALCRHAPGLLLLSATPMRGDFGMLQALLNLIDPVAFPLANFAAFVARIEQRVNELTDADALTSHFSTESTRRVAADRIVACHANDTHVRTLAGRAPKDAARAEELAAYLRETYRISRRMVRHRRSVAQAVGYPTAGRMPFICEVAADDVDGVIDDFLESYRDCLRESGGDHIRERFWRAVNAALGGLGPLARFIEERLAVVANIASDHEAERVLLEKFRASVRLSDDRRVAVALAETVRRVRAGQRVVAISGFSAEAEKFYAAATAELGGQHVVYRHFIDMPDAACDDSADLYLGSRTGALLVGDRSVEEGRNLQGSHAMLNLDLPLSPNRIEQRVGRVDRYVSPSDSDAGTPEIIVLRRAASAWCGAQMSVLVNGIGVFSDSVSTAQRFLAKWETNLRESLLDGGVDRLTVGVGGLRGLIETEQAEVDELEAWESDAAPEIASPLTTESFDNYEMRSEDLRRALVAVCSPQGDLPVQISGSSTGRVIRFAPRLGRNPIPLSLDLHRNLSRRFTFTRRDALALGDANPFRIGDPFVDSLQRELLTDERGRSFAVISSDRFAAVWDMWLRCEFLVQFGRHVLDALPTGDHRRLRRRGHGFLGPRLVRIWASGERVADAALTEHLDRLLGSQANAVRQSIPWQLVLEEIHDWQTECHVAAKFAQASLETSPEFQGAVARASGMAAADLVRRQRILEARAQRLPSVAERLAATQEQVLDRRVSSLILQGVENPEVRLVSCGALIRRPA